MNHIKITTKDSCGIVKNYVSLNSIESFSSIQDTQITINTKTGHQFIINKKFSTVEYGNITLNFDEIVDLICSKME
jgi:hypothetical protein